LGTTWKCVHIYKKKRGAINMEEYRGFIHVVQEGDTLYDPSRRYGILLPSIFLANPYVNVYNLLPGDELLIPGRVKPKWPQR